MAAGGDDYTWVTESYAFGLNFCLTLVRSRSADDVIVDLGGADPVEITGVHRVLRVAPEVSAPLMVAVTAAGAWTMLLEPDGYLGVQHDVAARLSGGGELLSFHVNENTDDRFVWAVDGDTVVTFDPSSAGWRYGSDPDRLTPVLRELGFDLSTDDHDPADPRYRYDERYQERTLALMERLTGVRLTSDGLRQAVFLCAALSDPGTPASGPGEAQRRLAAFAADPDGGEDGDGEIGGDTFDWWADLGVADEQLRATGFPGASLAAQDLGLVRALAQLDAGDHERIMRWGRDWGFAAAELADQPWFAAVREVVRRGEPVPDSARDVVAAHRAPLPVAPTTEADGRLDLGSRHFLAMGLLDEPDSGDSLTDVCEVLQTAAAIDNDRYDRLFADLRRAFPDRL